MLVPALALELWTYRRTSEDVKGTPFLLCSYSTNRLGEGQVAWGAGRSRSDEQGGEAVGEQQKEPRLWNQVIRGSVMSLTSCGPWENHLPDPYYPHLLNGANNSTSCIRLLQEFKI